MIYSLGFPTGISQPNNVKQIYTYNITMPQDLDEERSGTYYICTIPNWSELLDENGEVNYTFFISTSSIIYDYTADYDQGDLYFPSLQVLKPDNTYIPFHSAMNLRKHVVLKIKLTDNGEVYINKETLGTLYTTNNFPSYTLFAILGKEKV